MEALCAGTSYLVPNVAALNARLRKPTHVQAASTISTAHSGQRISRSSKKSPLQLSSSLRNSHVGGSTSSGFAGEQLWSATKACRIPSSGSRRGVVTMVIPFQRGDARQQPPPDLPSYLFANRIVFLGMSLVPAVTELIMAELLYLQYEDATKPIYMYINSTGTQKDGEKLGYETEAFAIYDTMMYVKPPIFTLCVGNAWGEAAMLLAAGAKGNRSALPSSSIMIRQPIAQFRGQATDIDNQRKEIRTVKDTLLKLYSRHMEKKKDEISADIERPKYFSPAEAILQTERRDESVVDQLRKKELI
eukprot:jgi/Mesen1/5234/ME000026S04537